MIEEESYSSNRSTSPGRMPAWRQARSTEMRAAFQIQEIEPVVQRQPVGHLAGAADAHQRVAVSLPAAARGG